MAVGTTNFPGSLDTYETLVRLGLGTETHLLQPITADMTSLVVADPSRLSAPSGLLLVGNEYITYSSASGNVMSGLARGQFQNDGGYPASQHPDGQRVLQFMTPIHHRVLVDAIIALQTALGAGTLVENIQDIVGAFTADSTSIDATYNDAGNVESLEVIPEAIQDIVGALVQDSSSIDATYNDAGNVESLAVIPEFIQDTVGALVSDSSTIDATYNDAGNVESLTVITDSSVQRSDYRINSGGSVVSRKQLNTIAGQGISLGLTDDAGSNEADLTITAQLPPGAITMYGGNSTAPDGWLYCDGSAVSRTTYAALFAVIGAAYGAGDGSTTFNVPNFQSRMPFGRETGQSANDTMGETGGARTVTLTAAQSGVPAHTHEAGALVTDTEAAHQHNGPTFGTQNNTQAGGGGDRLTQQLSGGGGQLTTAAGSHSHDVSGDTAQNATASAASSHENLPPFLVVNFIVKT